jgi:hypothetical protein
MSHNCTAVLCWHTYNGTSAWVVTACAFLRLQTVDMLLALLHILLCISVTAASPGVFKDTNNSMHGTRCYADSLFVVWQFVTSCKPAWLIPLACWFQASIANQLIIIIIMLPINWVGCSIMLHDGCCCCSGYTPQHAAAY